MDSTLKQQIEKLVSEVPDPPDKEWKQRFIAEAQASIDVALAKEESLEAQAYRSMDLAFKQKGLDYQFVNIWKFRVRIALASFLLSVLGFGFVGIGLWYNAISVRSNVQQNMTRLALDLDKVFVDKPSLLQYFEGGADIRPSDPNFAEAYATAIMMLDVMDVAEAQNNTFRRFWSNSQAWSEWEKDEFTFSPLLRRVFADRKGWYGKDLRKIYEEGVSRASKNPIRMNFGVSSKTEQPIGTK